MVLMLLLLTMDFLENNLYHLMTILEKDLNYYIKTT